MIYGKKELNVMAYHTVWRKGLRLNQKGFDLISFIMHAFDLQKLPFVCACGECAAHLEYEIVFFLFFSHGGGRREPIEQMVQEEKKAWSSSLNRKPWRRRQSKGITETP